MPRSGKRSTSRARLGQSRRAQLPRADFLAPHCREELVGLAEPETLRQLFEAHGALSPALQLALHGGAPRSDDARDFAAVEPLADLVSRARAFDVAERRVEPVAARAAGLGRDDLDAFSVLEPVIERDDGTVHLGAAAAVADVGVQRVGEIDRSRPLRQLDDPALR